MSTNPTFLELGQHPDEPGPPINGPAAYPTEVTAVATFAPFLAGTARTPVARLSPATVGRAGR
jgi:NADH-quinone oxidoreductase subunit E